MHEHYYHTREVSIETLAHRPDNRRLCHALLHYELSAIQNEDSSRCNLHIQGQKPDHHIQWLTQIQVDRAMKRIVE